MGSYTIVKNVPETVPFPDGYPVIELPQISLKKLLENCPDEMEKIWEICKSTGFFYLNLTDHPKGIRLWNDGVDTCLVGQETLAKLSMEEKLAYKARERLGVFDMGYKCPSVGPDGQPKFSEAFNVPLYELAVDPQSGFQLPPWLSEHRDLFISLLQNGNTISNILLSVLEKQLQLSNGELLSLHRFTDPSNDFLRVLRYPGTPEGMDVSQTNFPPHRDAVSIAVLFTWVGGLQILDPTLENPLPNGSVGEGDNRNRDDGWRWVKPTPGHVIVNLGDGLSILTNGILKSGFHRVITAPGSQRPIDKYSVLLGYRPALTTKMTPLVSPVIPPLTSEQRKAPLLSCEEWGAQRVQKVYTVLENR